MLDQHLFGLARGEKCGEEEKKGDAAACGIVWRAELDTDGEVTNVFRSKRIMSMKHDDYFVGMRDRMDYDANFGTYWIDAI